MNDCSRPSVVTRAAFWGPTHYKTGVLETCTESVLFDVIVESKIIKHCHIQIAMSQFLFMMWDIHPPPPLFCLQRKPTQKLSAITCQKIRSTCQTNNIQQSFDDSRYELLHTQLDNYWKFDNLFKSFEFRKWWMANHMQSNKNFQNYVVLSDLYVDLSLIHFFKMCSCPVNAIQIESDNSTSLTDKSTSLSENTTF